MTGALKADSPARGDAVEEMEANDEASVRQHVSEMKELAAGLSVEDLRSGGWFTKLLRHALHQYGEKVDWEYFERKYPGMPRDGVVDARIKLASRFSALEGALSASAYTGAVAATIGSAGGASPLTGSAALLSFSVDLFSTTTIQHSLAHDLAVLYRIPVDFDDPEDLWNFIRTAFAIKGGEVARGAGAKGVPVVLRPLIKRYYGGAVLAAGKSLPVVGKYLLQRNVIKFAIPLVGVPLSAGMNHWTTRIAGEHARKTYRAEAEIRETSRRVVVNTPPHRAALWVAWLVFTADGRANEVETVMMRHLIALMDEMHGVRDAELMEVVNLRRETVWALISEVEEGHSCLYDLGLAAAEVDGKVNAEERKILDELATRCVPLN